MKPFKERTDWRRRIYEGFLVGDDCWEWQLGLDYYGYGKIKIARRDMKVHRVAYELFTGTKIPENMSVDHLCQNKRCARPSHLEIVSRGENARRGWERGEYNSKRKNAACEHGPSDWYERPSGTGGYCRSCRNRNRADRERLSDPISR